MPPTSLTWGVGAEGTQALHCPGVAGDPQQHLQLVAQPPQTLVPQISKVQSHSLFPSLLLPWQRLLLPHTASPHTCRKALCLQPRKQPHRLPPALRRGRESPGVGTSKWHGQEMPTQVRDQVLLPYLCHRARAHGAIRNLHGCGDEFAHRWSGTGGC